MQMFFRFSTIIFCCLFLCSTLQAVNSPFKKKTKHKTMKFSYLPDDILGKWWSPEKDGKIEFYKKGNKYYGKLVWSNGPLAYDSKGIAKKDINNPVAAMRSQTIINSTNFKDFEYVNGKWDNGNVYDPRSGYTYSCTLWLEGKDVLKVRGYLGFSLIGKTETMTRVK